MDTGKLLRKLAGTHAMQLLQTPVQSIASFPLLSMLIFGDKRVANQT